VLPRQAHGGEFTNFIVGPRMTPSWVHSIHNYQTAQHYIYASLFKAEASGMKRRAEDGRWLRVTLHIHSCSGRNRNPLLRRQKFDSTPNKSVTLPLNQLLIRYVVTSPDHIVTMRCYGTR